MNKFKFYFILTIITGCLFSCSKNDTDSVEPIRDYQTQYDTDITTIETYLKTYTFTVTNAPGETSDQDVTMAKITDPATQVSIMSYLNAATYPKLLYKTVTLNSVNYKLYYLVLRPGTGQSPCSVDGVFSAYRGDYLYNTVATTDPVVPSIVAPVRFEEVVYPSSFLSLFSTITGWAETFPLFKTGTSIINSNGTVTYNDFGAGVMFIPSGLGYYSTGSYSIPAYAPLVFSFKLYEIQRLDQDSDGIPSYLEDLNGDGFVRYLGVGVDNPDDTDKDGIPDFYDVDDDGDNYTTKLEIKDPTTGQPYPFDLIPTCTYNNVTKKNYLMPTCHP